MSLDGQVIFFTGTLSMEGADAKARAEAAGAHVCSSFTAETTLVVSGPGADKYVLVASAASLMSTIWDEETFVAAVSTTHMPGAPSSSSSSSDAPGPAIGRMLTSKAVPTRISTMRVRAVLVPCLPTAEALTPPHGDADYLFKFAVDLGGVQSVKARLEGSAAPWQTLLPPFHLGEYDDEADASTKFFTLCYADEGGNNMTITAEELADRNISVWRLLHEATGEAQPMAMGRIPGGRGSSSATSSALDPGAPQQVETAPPEVADEEARQGLQAGVRPQMQAEVAVEAEAQELGGDADIGASLTSVIIDDDVTKAMADASAPTADSPTTVLVEM